MMKRALAGVLPDSVLPRREKRGFGAPMGAWLRAELAPVLRGVLSHESVMRRGLLDPGGIERTIREHEQQKADRTDHLLALINLEIWCRLYLDGAERRGCGRPPQAGARRLRPPKMSVLFVCHRVPFPPKRGGKIEVQHHPAPARARARGHRRIARAQAEARRGRGPRFNTVRIESFEVVDERIVWPRMVAWSRRTRPSSFGYFHSPPRQRSGSVADLDGRRRTHHLGSGFRALLVRGAVHEGFPAPRSRSSTSATWTRRSGVSIRSTSRFRSRRVTGSKLSTRAYGAAARGAVRSGHLYHARRDGIPAGAGRQHLPTGSRTVWTHSSSSPRSCLRT